MGSAGSGVPLKKTYEKLNRKHMALIEHFESLVKNEKRNVEDIKYLIQASRTEEERQYHKGRRDTLLEYVQKFEEMTQELYRNN